MPIEGSTTFDDAVYGSITIENKELEDQILLKSDGYPTYNFANVIDDHLMKITHVVRGCEYLTSTPKYNLLYEAFGWDVPTYVHLPLIMGKNPDGTVSKLSKRHGSTGFADLVKEGYLPEVIVNYIALLGWCPKDNREIFTLDELVQNFSIDGVSKSPAVFDYEKLLWLNGEYLRAMTPEEFTRRAMPYYREVFPEGEQPVGCADGDSSAARRQIYRNSGNACVFPRTAGLPGRTFCQQKEQDDARRFRRYAEGRHSGAGRRSRSGRSAQSTTR